MIIKFVEDANCIDFHRICEVYDNCGWNRSAITEARIQRTLKVFNQSSYVAVACDTDGNYLGFSRALSDGISTSWIAELIVIESAQRKGVGSKILARTMEKLGHTDVYLETFSGKEKFFENQGLKSRNNMVVCSRGKKNGPPMIIRK
jgi:GNAT superfamily N-acetyltransferase